MKVDSKRSPLIQTAQRKKPASKKIISDERDAQPLVGTFVRKLKKKTEKTSPSRFAP